MNRYAADWIAIVSLTLVVSAIIAWCAILADILPWARCRRRRRDHPTGIAGSTAPSRSAGRRARQLRSRRWC